MVLIGVSHPRFLTVTTVTVTASSVPVCFFTTRLNACALRARSVSLPLHEHEPASS